MEKTDWRGVCSTVGATSGSGALQRMEDVQQVVSGWPMPIQPGQLTDCVKGEGDYASFTASALITDSSCSSSVSSSSRNGWKAP